MLIRTTPELEAACAVAGKEGVLALDTEFVWARTYLPRLGIVQMGCRGGNWVLDCRSGMHLDAFATVVESSATVKILHAAGQDLALVRQFCGASAKNVFDTQLAAAFAGFGAGIGLQKLLFDAIGVGLPKTETLTDWTMRPLSPAQVEYALDDVRYLPALRDDLIARTKSLGTIDWLMEDLAAFDGGVPSIEHVPEEAWRKVKCGRVRLDRKGLAILRELAACRERMAKEWNLPRAWLGDDGSLAQMAQEGRLTRMRHRLAGREEMMRGLYAKAIESALAAPEEEWPEDIHPHYIDEVRDAADEAMEWLAERAEEIHVASTVIATRAVVTAFVDNVDDETNPLSSGWRYEVVGRDMARLFGVD